jgi:hypothetical protein
MKYFTRLGPKKLGPKWCRVGVKLFCNTLDSTPNIKHLGPIFSFPPIILPTNNIAQFVNFLGSDS